MSIEQFITEATIESPGNGVTLAELRRQYARATGQIVTRSGFLTAVAAAKFPLLAIPGRQVFLTGRALAQPALV